MAEFIDKALVEDYRRGYSIEVPRSCRGTCYTCGLVGKVPITVTPSGSAVTVAPLGQHAEPTEVTWGERDSGQEMPIHIPALNQNFRSSFVCFDGKRIGFEGGVAAETETSAALLGRKNCPAWIGYRANLSPRWHLERRDMNDMERERRRFEWFLAGTTVIVALAAMVVSLLSVPEDSWLMCEVGFSVCSESTTPSDPNTVTPEP